jgi:DNA polymerase
MASDCFTFDWCKGADYPYIPQEIISNWDVARMSKQENPYERKHRMLRQLNNTCVACSMCELGRKDVERDNIIRDPHVLSNMNPVPFMIVGQGPGYEEIKQRTPFVGQSGKNFDKELAKHGIDRSRFYITNTVKCFIDGNAKPNYLQTKRCKPFLMMEIALIHPSLVVTLGMSAFDMLCPGAGYQQSLGRITKSEEFEVSIFAVYHPSPLNLADKVRRADFEHQIALLAKLIKRLSASA